MMTLITLSTNRGNNLYGIQLSQRNAEGGWDTFQTQTLFRIWVYYYYPVVGRQQNMDCSEGNKLCFILHP